MAPMRFGIWDLAESATDSPYASRCEHSGSYAASDAAQSPTG
jgi:hypothetical protein